MSIIFERRRRAAPRNNVLASWSKLARTKRWLLPSPRSSLSSVLFADRSARYLSPYWWCIHRVVTGLSNGLLWGQWSPNCRIKTHCFLFRVTPFCISLQYTLLRFNCLLLWEWWSNINWRWLEKIFVFRCDVDCLGTCNTCNTNIARAGSLQVCVDVLIVW